MTPIFSIINELLQSQGHDIWYWIEAAYAKTPPAFYSSVDLRHSGHKIAPVDTNLFPAGFNLLSPVSKARAAEEVRKYFSRYQPAARNVLLIPENHTRNLYYLDNVASLVGILEKAGVEVKIGGLEATSILELEGKSGAKLTIHPIQKQGNIIGLSNFTPDLILVNNDLTSGEPEILKSIAQPIIPPLGLGWYRRRKTTHFEAYSQVAKRFGDAFKLDPWLISTDFERCHDIDFKQEVGLECVAFAVEKLLRRIRKKYEDFGIRQEPYVFVKADSGTYGMGIMSVRSAEEMLDLNKKARNKMDIIKEGTQNTEVIIQEGVPTVDVIDGSVAEPLVYLIAGHTVGCTYRINDQRDDRSNLNAPGMTFKDTCDANTHRTNPSEVGPCPVLGLIAGLASLAATQECYEAGWVI